MTCSLDGRGEAALLESRARIRREMADDADRPGGGRRPVA